MILRRVRAHCRNPLYAFNSVLLHVIFYAVEMEYWTWHSES